MVELTAIFFKLIAAFTSLSWHVAQAGHVRSRTASGNASSVCPQPEQVLLLG